MKHIKLSLWTKEFFQGSLNNWPILLFYLFLIPMVILFSIIANISNIQRYGVEHCLADLFILLTDKYTLSFVIIPLSISYLLQLFKNDFKIPFILRQRSKQSLWLKQAYKTLLFSVLFSTYISAITFLIGGLYSPSYINWSYKNSVYYLANKAINSDVAFTQVFVMFWLVSTLLIFLVNLLFQFMNWLTNKVLAGWLLILLIGCWDMFYGLYPVLYGRISIQYVYWENTSHLMISIIYAFILIGFLSIASLIISKRRDFWHEYE